MTKKELFLKKLEEQLAGLPKEETDRRIEFYSEMIDDRIEEGKTEEEALQEIGSVDEVVSQIASETPLLKLMKEKVKPKSKIQAWQIVLIVLGFPIWFPLLMVALVLILVAYILIWVLVIVCFAVELALSVSTVACLVLFFSSGGNYGFIGMMLLAAGLSIFLLFGCIGATKLTIKLTKKIALGIKKRIVSRG